MGEKVMDVVVRLRMPRTHEPGYEEACDTGRQAEADARLRCEAADEIERLRADKARLDWLADKDNTIGQVLLPYACVEANLHSLRAAIDAAMATTKEGDDHA
jgi:hypothetical protein